MSILVITFLEVVFWWYECEVWVQNKLEFMILYIKYSWMHNLSDLFIAELLWQKFDDFKKDFQDFLRTFTIKNVKPLDQLWKILQTLTDFKAYRTNQISKKTFIHILSINCCKVLNTFLMKPKFFSVFFLLHTY